MTTAPTNAVGARASKAQPAPAAAPTQSNPLPLDFDEVVLPKTAPKRKSIGGAWTDEQVFRRSASPETFFIVALRARTHTQKDEILRIEVEKFNGKNWKKIAEALPSKTDVQWCGLATLCRSAARLTRRQQLASMAKSAQSNARQGARRQSLVVVGRRALNKRRQRQGPWTKVEDDKIVELVNRLGAKKWSKIAEHLPGRIGKQCRERCGGGALRCSAVAADAAAAIAGTTT